MKRNLSIAGETKIGGSHRLSDATTKTVCICVQTTYAQMNIVTLVVGAKEV